MRNAGGLPLSKRNHNLNRELGGEWSPISLTAFTVIRRIILLRWEEKRVSHASDATDSHCSYLDLIHFLE